MASEDTDPASVMTEWYDEKSPLIPTEVYDPEADEKDEDDKKDEKGLSFLDLLNGREGRTKKNKE